MSNAADLVNTNQSQLIRLCFAPHLGSILLNAAEFTNLFRCCLVFPEQERPECHAQMQRMLQVLRVFTASGKQT